jgi:hypothetical protein
MKVYQKNIGQENFMDALEQTFAHWFFPAEAEKTTSRYLLVHTS